MCKQDFGVAADVKSVEALGEFVQEQYQRVLQTGLGMETTVQSLVTVTQHFMASQQHSLSPQVGRCGAWCVEGRSGGWGGGGGGVCVCVGARPWQPLCSCWSPSPNTSWPPNSTACLHRLVGVGLGVWRGNEVGKG